MSHVLTSRELRQIIKEEKILIESYGTVEKVLIAEARMMELDGYSIQEINEGILSSLIGGVGSLLGGLPSGVVDVLKNKVAMWILTKLGLDEKGLIAKALANVIEAIDVTELSKYFSDEGCEEFGEEVVHAIAETMAEEGLDRLAGVLGIADTSSVIYQTFRESLTNNLLESELGQSIKSTVAGFVCNLNISDALSGIKGIPSKLAGMFGGGDSPAPAPAPAP